MSEQPRVTLTHIPACNDVDDSRETLATHASPEAARCTDAIIWRAEVSHFPARLDADALTWLRGHAAREGQPLRLTTDAYEVACYFLGRRDGALLADEARPLACDDPAPSGALAAGFGAVCGFITCLIFVAIGYWLAY